MPYSPFQLVHIYAAIMHAGSSCFRGQSSKEMQLLKVIKVTSLGLVIYFGGVKIGSRKGQPEISLNFFSSKHLYGLQAAHKS